MVEYAHKPIKNATEPARTSIMADFVFFIIS